MIRIIRSRIFRAVGLFLIPALLLFVLPGYCNGQVITDSGYNDTTTDSSGGSSEAKQLTMALFVVVVAILVWVGWTFDREYSADVAGKEKQMCSEPATRIRPFVLENRKGFTNIRDSDENGVTELAGRVGIGIQVPF